MPMALGATITEKRKKVQASVNILFAVYLGLFIDTLSDRHSRTLTRSLAHRPQTATIELEKKYIYGQS